MRPLSNSLKVTCLVIRKPGLKSSQSKVRIYIITILYCSLFLHFYWYLLRYLLMPFGSSGSHSWPLNTFLWLCLWSGRLAYIFSTHMCTYVLVPLLGEQIPLTRRKGREFKVLITISHCPGDGKELKLSWSSQLRFKQIISCPGY